MISTYFTHWSLHLLCNHILIIIFILFNVLSTCLSLSFLSLFRSSLYFFLRLNVYFKLYPLRILPSHHPSLLCFSCFLLISLVLSSYLLYSFYNPLNVPTHCPSITYFSCFKLYSPLIIPSS